MRVRVCVCVCRRESLYVVNVGADGTRWAEMIVRGCMIVVAGGNGYRGGGGRAIWPERYLRHGHSLT